jgi:protein RecA
MARQKKEDSEKPEKKGQPKRGDLKSLLASINANYGPGTILPASEAISLVVDRIPTGIFDLDMKIGGGIPRGRITIVKGDFSTGKSGITYKTAANAQRHCRFCGKAFEIVDDLTGEVTDIDCKCGKRSPMRVVVLDAEHCLAEGTLVYESSEGRYVPVDTLPLGVSFKTLSFDKEGNFKETNAIVSDSGVRSVYEVQTRGGRSIKLTGNHKVLTSCGYSEVSELVPGDIVYTPKKIELSIPGESNSLYRLLGLHIGDGLHDKASISNIDTCIIEDIEAIVSPLDCRVNVSSANVNIVSTREEYNLDRDSLLGLWNSNLYVSEIADLVGCGRDTIVDYLEKFSICSSFERRSRASRLKLERPPKNFSADPKFFKGRKNKVHLWLEQFECFGKFSVDRRLPKGLSRSQLSQVLAGIFMADGSSVDPAYQKRASAHFSTTSRLLALDIQSALLQFGIYSSLSPSEKDGYCINWKVSIQGLEDIESFLSSFPIYSYKRERLEKAVASIKSSDRREYYKNYIKLEILSVTELPEKHRTFDVSLEEIDFDEQNFLSEGLIIHNSFDPTWVAKWGVCVEDLLVIQTEYAEQAIDVADQCIRSRECDLLIVDSIAALTPGIEVEESAEKWQVGVMARLLGKAFRKWTSGLNSFGLLSETRCTIFMVNQLRLALGGYHPTVTSPGGKAPDFYQSVELRLKKSEEIVDKGSGRPIGVQVEFVVKKNKTYPVTEGGQFALYFVAQRGAHRVGDTDTAVQVIRAASYWGIIQRAGAGWLTMPDGSKVQGDEKAGILLSQNPVLMKDLMDRVRSRELMWQEEGLERPNESSKEPSSEETDSEDVG